MKEHGLSLSKKDADALHYALLFADTDAKLCRRLMQSLKPSRDELNAAETVQKSGNSPDAFAEEPFVYAVKLLMKAGGDDFPKKTALYRYALGTLAEETALAAIGTAEDLASRGVCVRLAQMNLGGSDLMPLGFAGPEIGLMLNTLLGRVMRGELENDREVLLRAARAAKESAEQ